MRIVKSLTLLAIVALFAVSCASSGDDSDNNTNNTNNVNNVNNNTGACSSYCPSNKVCVGSSDEHSTCVDPCPCSADKVCYQNGCVDLFTDENNCGAGGVYCTGECINGQCTDACAASGTPCSATQSCCQEFGSYVCRDLNSDMNNCGTCGTVCDSTAANACISGQCACGTTAACGNATTCCSNSCKDLTSDVYNCGSCGNACGTGLSCSNGQCMCGSVACGFGESCCGTYCTNLDTDSTNCGSCGNDCGTGNACVAGQCGCGTSGEICNPENYTAEGCIDLSFLGMGNSCTMDCCDGSCTILSNIGIMGSGGEGDTHNCGTCGNDCGGTPCCCSMLGCECCASGYICSGGQCTTAKK